MENDQLSRKERRELRRLQQRQGEVSGSRKRILRRVLIWGGSIAVIAGLFWLAFKAGGSITPPNQNGNLAVPVSAADHILGSSDAPITLVEYSDYQCPACAAFYPIIKRVMDEPDLKGKVRFVYRNFPLTGLHAHAQLSAQAAEAAALQGKFWEMHDALFEGQAKWSGMSDAGARAEFMKYAADLKLDTARFSSDIDSSQVKDRIAADVAGGNAAGINGTPTFFVNGIRMPQPQNYDEFKNYIAHGIQPTP